MIGNNLKIKIAFFSFVAASLSEWKTFNEHLRPIEVDPYQYNVIEDLNYMSKSNEDISSVQNIILIR